jgi:hypothetical protein
MNKKLPKTSLAANKEMTQEMRDTHFDKIKAALLYIGRGNYETIAFVANIEPHAVARRLKEMEGLELIRKSPTQSHTKSGRMAFNYFLPTAQELKSRQPELF